MGRRLTQEEFIEKARKVHGDRYDYSKVKYVNNSTDVCIICKEHGEFLQKPKKHLSGHGCIICANIERNKKKSFTQEEFEEKAKTKHNGKYTYNNDYINGTTNIKIKCPIHGDFYQTPYHHLRGEGCPKCGIEKNHNLSRKTYEEFVNEANIIHNNKYQYTKAVYLNYKTRISIICPEHGEFWQTPDAHLHRHGCPKCGNQISNGEAEIVEYIKSISEYNIETRNKDIIPNYELDIYIPQKKIAIEYDGLIWHSEKFRKDRKYHLNKTELCEERGIRLIHIFEDEWLEHKEIVKSKIRHILDCEKDLKKIYARKCEIKEITKNVSDKFLNKNHIQGAVTSTIYLGCFYNKQLISVMLFKKVNNNLDYELIRFASDNDYLCIGVGGKLFKYFIRNYDFNEIKSFADRRWSSLVCETIYDKLGFKLDSILKPDYSYVDYNGNRKHKFLFRKKHLVKKYEDLDMSMTESEMANKVGLYKIWNCGLIRYIFNKKQ